MVYEDPDPHDPRHQDVQAYLGALIQQADTARCDAEQLVIVARAEESRLRCELDSYRRATLFSSSLGVLGLLLAVGSFLLYRQWLPAMPTVSVVAAAIALVLGAGQLIYIAYERSSGVAAETRGALLELAEFTESADKYHNAVKTILFTRQDVSKRHQEHESGEV